MGTIRFMDFPRELRDRVYEASVKVGKIFLPPIWVDDLRYDGLEKHEQPNWNLLLVSKQIRQEAGEMMFQENTIVTSMDADNHVYQTVTMGQPDVDDYWFARMSENYLTSVSLAFDVRDTRFGTLYFLSNMRTGEDTRFRPSRLTDEEKIWRHHRSDIDGYIHHWSSLLQLMTIYCTRLETLQIDLTCCICHQGCRRLVAKAVVPSIKETEFDNPRLRTIEILGTQNRRERDLITEALVQRLAADDYFRRFDGEFGRMVNEMTLQFIPLDETLKRRNYYSTVEGPTEDMADEIVNLRIETEAYQRDQEESRALMMVLEHF